VTELLANAPLPAYDERRGTGYLKELILRSAPTGVLAGFLVTPDSKFNPALHSLVEGMSGSAAGVSVAVSNEDDANINDCNDIGGRLRLVAGFESLPVHGLQLQLHSDAFTCSSTLAAVLDDLRSVLAGHDCLVVNSSPYSFVRQVPTRSATYLNHSTSGTRYNGPDVSGDLIGFGADISEYISALSVDTVLVMGEFSEKLRNWVMNSEGIHQVIYLTDDLNKVVHDADKFRQSFKLAQAKLFDAELHNMRIVILAKLIRCNK
jgi:hypothetical protein